MNLEIPKRVYFIGIGGIGMSALARFCMAQNHEVAGYDKTRHQLAEKLEEEGFLLNYKDEIEEIPRDFRRGDSLIIYTPAVPKNHRQLNHFKRQGNKILKRAEFLAFLSNGFKSFAVAGTHGKTTTSSMLSHILTACGKHPWSFLGGIANNIESNFQAGESDFMVLEADEFDRSFLHLKPSYCLISSIEADHLDIYKEEAALVASFNDLAKITKNNEGKLLVHDSVAIPADYTYGGTTGDYRIVEKKLVDGIQQLKLKSPDGEAAASLILPGIHNAENALGALALAHLAGVDWKKACKSLAGFTGVYRRFNVHIRLQDAAYIDDYAHHPTEIVAAIQAARELYQDMPLMVVFQPHLYSRTRDFMQAFADGLSAADELVLLPIYGAREEPMEGISSEVLLKMTSNQRKEVVAKDDFIEWFKERGFKGLVMTLGAGDIDQLVSPLKFELKKRWDEA